MFRRLFWLMVGAALGFAASFWLMRAIRRTAARYTPERIAADVSDGVKSFGADIRAAVADGKVAMREREAELRAELGRSR